MQGSIRQILGCMKIWSCTILEKSQKEVQNKYGNRIIGSYGTGNTLFEKASSRIHDSESRKKSYHPDDSHLYMVSAKKGDGTYAVWTSWNQKTESLNHGHYGLQSEEACEKIMDEFYHSKDLVL